MSGGFYSFDSSIVHFGLGQFEKVKWIEILWSDGETTKVNGPFLSNTENEVYRKKIN